MGGDEADSKMKMKSKTKRSDKRDPMSSSNLLPRVQGKVQVNNNVCLH